LEARVSVIQPRELLGPKRRCDTGLERTQVERERAQPGDHVLLGKAVLVLVVKLERHSREPFRRELRQHVCLRAAHIAVGAQVPVQPFECLRSAEPAAETGA